MQTRAIFVRGEKLLELEGVRGIAALLVFAHHLPPWHAALYELRALRSAYLLVDLFFVLSGFVLYRNYAGRLSGARDVLRFQLLRIGRLYPVHALFLFAFALAELAKWLVAARFGLHSPNAAPFAHNDAAAFAKNALLVHGLGFRHALGTFNGPSWSISVEFYTYLLFALFTALPSRWRLGSYALCALAAGCALASASFLTTHEGYVDLVRCVAGFFTGCLAAALSAWAGARSAPRLPRASPLVALTALGAFLYWKPEAGPCDELVLVPAVALVWALCHAPRGRITAFLCSAPVAYAGKISYSIYMSHALVIWIFNQLLRVVLKRPESGIPGHLVPALSLAEAIVVDAALLVTVLSTSALVYAVVEQPARAYSRRWVRERFSRSNAEPRASVSV